MKINRVLLNETLHHIRDFLSRHFLARWVAANIIGWLLGLTLAALIATTVRTGIIGLLLAGGVTGLTVATAQHFAWRGAFVDGRRWLIASVLGGMSGIIPAFFAGVLILIDWNLGLAAVGSAYATTLGLAQYAVMQHKHEAAPLWVFANLFGGALCGGLWVVQAIPLWFLFVWIGPLVFGLITGMVMTRLIDSGST